METGGKIMVRRCVRSIFSYNESGKKYNDQKSASNRYTELCYNIGTKETWQFLCIRLSLPDVKSHLKSVRREAGAQGAEIFSWSRIRDIDSVPI
jgi:hypothetical protein